MSREFLEAVIAVTIFIQQTVFFAKEQSDQMRLILDVECERIDKLQDVDGVEYNARSLL